MQRRTELVRKEVGYRDAPHLTTDCLYFNLPFLSLLTILVTGKKRPALLVLLIFFYKISNICLVEVKHNMSICPMEAQDAMQS